LKSAYFTFDTIDHTSLKLIRKIKETIKIHDIPFIPESSALLILDMQQYFLDSRSHAYISDAIPVIPRIKALAQVFQERGLPVILTRHINSEDNAQLMAEWWKDMITEENDLSAILPELDLPNSIIIKKTQYDAFHRTNLEKILRERNVRQLVITGVMTHLCCDTTARSAFVKGFTVFFPVDATATYNENFHYASFLNLSHGCAIPVLSNEIKKQMENSSSER